MSISGRNREFMLIFWAVTLIVVWFGSTVKVTPLEEERYMAVQTFSGWEILFILKPTYNVPRILCEYLSE